MMTQPHIDMNIEVPNKYRSVYHRFPDPYINDKWNEAESSILDAVIHTLQGMDISPKITDWDTIKLWLHLKLRSGDLAPRIQDDLAITLELFYGAQIPDNWYNIWEQELLDDYDDWKISQHPKS